MVRWLGILLGTLRSTVRTHRELTLENLALRQQLAGWKALQPRPRVTATDRIFWVALSRLWKSWRNSLQMVRPETAVGWHRQGFRRYWAWKSGRRRGRPAIRTELRDLIRHQPRQSSMGCAEDSRRAAEAGPDGIAGDGFEVHAPAAAAAVAGVAHIFEESRQGSDRVGFLHGAHSDLSGPVRARGAEPRPASAGAFQCHGTSDRGLDCATTDRGVRAGGGPTASDPGPRPGLWRTIFASGQDVGHQGSRHFAKLALAKRLCPARDWIDSTGMP